MIVLLPNDYNAYLCSHNSESIIRESLKSILGQEYKPENIFVFDDNSTDNTLKILLDIQLENKGNDCPIYIMESNNTASIDLLPNHFNDLFRFAERLNKRDVDYELITSDDIILYPDYCKSLIQHMNQDDRLAITSGNEIDMIHKLPRGIRMIRKSFLDDSTGHGYFYPNMAWESGLIYDCMRLGYSFQIFNDVKFIHQRELGKNHNFIPYGKAMKALEYSKPYILGRLLINLIHPVDFPRKKIINVIIGYLQYKNDKPFPKSFTNFIHKEQNRKIINYLKYKLSYPKDVMMFAGGAVFMIILLPFFLLLTALHREVELE